MTKFVIVAILALAASLVSAYDPSPSQDFCVAVNYTDSAGMYILSPYYQQYIVVLSSPAFFRDHFNLVLHIMKLCPTVMSYIIYTRDFFPLHDMLLSIVTGLSYL